MTMYRAADNFVEAQRTNRADLIHAYYGFGLFFQLPSPVDLTNTYFEGEVPHNTKARRGRSKQKTHGLSAGDAGFSLGR